MKSDARTGTAGGAVPGALHTAAVTAVGAGTTLATTLAWTGLTERPDAYLRHLVAVALLLVVGGTLLRVARVPRGLVAVVQLLVATGYCAHQLAGSVVPSPETVAATFRVLAGAAGAAQDYSAPVPSEAGLDGVQPILLVGGAGCLVLVDLLVGTLRRASLAGLPLLGIYSVPVSILARVDWWVFVLAAVGFCLLLVLEHVEATAAWGRRFGDGRGGLVAAPVQGGRAALVAGVAIGLSLSVPAVVPNTEVGLLPGLGGGGSGDVSLENPMVDLRRDLLRGEDVPLVRVRTREPGPGYLRTAVLTRFTENTWSSGDRDIPADQVARGEMPPLQGVRQQVPRREFAWDLEVAEAFDSPWLPTPAPISRIDASDSFKYDRNTRDFYGGDADEGSGGMSYSSTAVRLDLDAAAMAEAPSGAGAVADVFTELPDSVPPLVVELAEAVTEEDSSDFEKARALQAWFRGDGGFTYSLETDPGSGTNDLVAFLSDEPGGRVGYCEQFSAAMAVMARVLDVPARIAVGFLAPEQVGPDEYVFSAHDLHSWTEVYVTGAGWVRFEPTPQARASDAPGYTTQPLPRDEDPDGSGPTPGAAQDPTPGPEAEQGGPGEEDPGVADADDGRPEGAGTGALVLGGGVLLLALGLLVPRLVRRRRRRRRLAPAAGVEAAWAELRDSAVDLGLPWPTGRSPRAIAEQVHAWMRTGAGPALGRPTGEEEAAAALDRLVLAVERRRFAPAPDPDPAGVGEDVRRCLDRLRAASAQDRVLRADWWPVSVFRRDLGSTYDAELSLDHISR